MAVKWSWHLLYGSRLGHDFSLRHRVYIVSGAHPPHFARVSTDFSLSLPPSPSPPSLVNLQECEPYNLSSYTERPNKMWNSIDPSPFCVSECHLLSVGSPRNHNVRRSITRLFSIVLCIHVFEAFCGAEVDTWIVLSTPPTPSGRGA